MKPSAGKVLAMLRVRGIDGLTPDQARRWCGTDRLAARVAELRAEGYVITTKYERHPGGTHARYVIEEPPVTDYANWTQGELAEAFGKYATHIPGLHILPIYGGQAYGIQLSGLRKGAQIIVGTPGRVIDHLEKGTLDLSELRVLGPHTIAWLDQLGVAHLPRRHELARLKVQATWAAVEVVDEPCERLGRPSLRRSLTGASCDLLVVDEEFDRALDAFDAHLRRRQPRP